MVSIDICRSARASDDLTGKKRLDRDVFLMELNLQRARSEAERTKNAGKSVAHKEIQATSSEGTAAAIIEALSNGTIS